MRGRSALALCLAFFCALQAAAPALAADSTANFAVNPVADSVANGAALPSHLNSALDTGNQAKLRASAVVPDEFLMPGATDGSELFVTDGSRFGFGAPTGADSFENRYVGYRMQIPEGFRCDYGAHQFAARYYTPEDALLQERAAIDLMVVSDELTEEQPDPEQINDNAMLLLGFYIPSAKADGSPVDAQAYVYSLFTKALGSSRLLDYVEAQDSQLAGKSWRHFTLDYTKALQTYYHSRYADGKEHPAFDEQFAFRLEAYVRRVGETYYLFYTLRSGTKYASATDLISYIGGLS